MFQVFSVGLLDSLDIEENIANGHYFPSTTSSIQPDSVKMMKLHTLVLLLVALIQSASAFTVRPAATQVRVQATPAASKALTPRPMFIDWGVASMADYPTGSIAMLLLSVTLWEITTPGRAKK